MRIGGTIPADCRYPYLRFVERIVRNNQPKLHPHWYYNIDSALYYIIYFAIGYIAYPFIMDLFECNTKYKKYIICISGVGSFVYSLLLFFDELFILYFVEFIFGQFSVIITSCILIWLNCLVAKLFENVQLFQEIGRETLFLCGNEYIIKTILGCALQLIGLAFQNASPLSFYVLTFILLIIGVKIIIPCEKELIKCVKVGMFVGDKE